MIRENPRAVRLWFFWTGIVATICYRAIIILNHYSSAAADIAWYIGTAGFVVYFSHRFRISKRRMRLIQEQHLIEKVSALSDLAADDREALLYLLRTLESTKERWNYIVIFVASGFALLFAVVLDIIGT